FVQCAHEPLHLFSGPARLLQILQHEFDLNNELGDGRRVKDEYPRAAQTLPLRATRQRPSQHEETDRCHQNRSSPATAVHTDPPSVSVAISSGATTAPRRAVPVPAASMPATPLRAP